MKGNDDLFRTITFEMLCELDPRLVDLYNRAQAVRDDKPLSSFCANRVWYGRNNQGGGLRGQLVKLVGYEASRDADARLRTPEAYDVAYYSIYDALPNCRNCGCFNARAFLEETGRLARKTETRRR
jgi:hypothetical protein